MKSGKFEIVMDKMKTAVFNSTGKLKRVLLGKPTYHQVIPVSDVARDLVDKGFEQDQATKESQHGELVDVFNQLEIQISWVQLTPEKLPWQMFTRDLGVNTPEGILIGRFRYLERKGEELVAKRSLEELGEKVLPKQVTRGAVEGGDCYWLDADTLVIGNGNRSTFSGFENAREIMSTYGKRVFVIEFLSKWNHLDNNFAPVADKLALVNEDALPGYFMGILDGLGWELIRVSGEYARTSEINVLALGDDKVLSFRNNRLNHVLRARGLEVFDPEYRFFIAHGGGIHCSTFELEREP
jgi:N-dimethylarginine dimethylaminohydrolase